jgi:5-enolpyruvylshikimate-3-phosphate synthase
VDFDAFFTHILMHELMHGLGPHQITVGGRATTVRQELEETYSAIEEAKADVSGLWALQQLIDAGILPKTLEQTMYTTFLASAFRSIRFGIDEAHGKAVAVQLNAFLDGGAVTVNADGTFAVVPGTIAAVVTALTREVMTLQAQGSHAKATALLARMGVVRPAVQKVLERLSDVPVDIAPRFVTAEALDRDSARTPD